MVASPLVGGGNAILGKSSRTESHVAPTKTSFDTRSHVQSNECEQNYSQSFPTQTSCNKYHKKFEITTVQNNNDDDNSRLHWHHTSSSRIESKQTHTNDARACAIPKSASLSRIKLDKKHLTHILRMIAIQPNKKQNNCLNQNKSHSVRNDLKLRHPINITHKTYSTFIANAANNLWMFLMFLITFSFQFATVASVSDPSQTTITTPASGEPRNSTILSSTNSTVTITARDATGTDSTADNETFFGELYSSGSCEVGYASSSCQVLCYPYNSPHTAASQCTSYSSRYTQDSDSALWVVTDVTNLGSGEYRMDYDDKVEVADVYDLSIYMLTNGGLRGRYWDNIWMVDSAVITQIDSEVEMNWGTSAITTYGTDYVSVRWEGKIKPPYNETYTFYIYADDGARLWIDKILIADSWDKCCNETWGSVDLDSEAFHDIIVEYREIRGEAFMELRWASDSIAKTIVPSTYLYYQDDIDGSPFTDVHIEVGAVSYTLSSVNDESPFTSNTAGVNNSVYVTARDAFGQVVSTDSANFTITDLDGAASVASWEGNGVYKITFQANTQTDNTSFSIQLGSPPTDILGSPYSVTVDPADTSPANTTLEGDGLTDAVAGQQATFNLTAYDLYGNERDEGTDDITVRFTGTEPGKGTCSYSGGGGVYNCEYTLTRTGVYTPIVQINEESAGPTPLPYVNVTSGTIHAPSCTIQSESTSIVAGTTENFAVQSRDQFGNIIPSTSDTYVVHVLLLGTVVTNSTTGTIENGTTSISSTIAADANGLYNVTYTPLVKGDYTVAVRLSGVDVDGSPYTVTVTPGPVSPEDCYVVGADYANSSVQFATSNVLASFIVQTVDAQNNTLESDMGGFSNSTLFCDTETVAANCSYLSAGQYQCDFTPTESGYCSLALEISSTHILGSPFSVGIYPGTIDADSCVVSGISDGVAGTESTFTIQARDTFGNDLTTAGFTFYVHLVDRTASTLEDTSDVSGTVTDNSDGTGTYSVSYTTDVANTYDSLRVTLFQVGGLLANYYTDYEMINVFESSGENVVDATVDFDWGTAVPLEASFGVSDYFSVQWDGHLYPPYSETYTLFTPIYGNSGVRLYIAGELVIDSWDPALGDTDPYALVQLSANTFYTIVLQFREQTGDAKISFEWNSPSIDGRQVVPSEYLYYTKTISNLNYVGNVSIIPADTDASMCVVSGAARTSATAGQGESITIRARDAYGNIQTDAGDESQSFNLTLTPSDGSDLIIGTVVEAGNNGADGLYTGTYNVTNATIDYTLEVTYNGTRVFSSTVAVEPGAISGHAGASSGDISPTRAGAENTFVLYLRDDYGNLCECGGVDNPISLNVNFTHSDGVTSVSASSMTEADGGSGTGQGIFTITFTATKSGEYSTFAWVEHTLLLGVTQEFNITDAIASADYTYIQGWENGADSDVDSGVATTQIIQVEDIYQNNLTSNGAYNFYVTLTDAANTTTTRGSLSALSDGRYELSYTASSAGDYTLSVRLASGDQDEPDGLTGEYFNNRWLYGSPLLTQIDANMTQDWADGLVTTTAKDYVSIRWTGFIKPDYAEEYTFTIQSDDGSRLRIDGTWLFDEFLSDAGTFSGNYTFSVAELLYPIRIDWRENTADADIQFFWESTSQASEAVPTSALFSSASHIMSSPFDITAV